MGNRLIVSIATDAYDALEKNPEDFAHKAINARFYSRPYHKDGEFDVGGSDGFQQVSLEHNSYQELIFADHNKAYVIQGQSEKLHQETREEAILRCIKSYLKDQGYRVVKRSKKNG